jgi:cytochrome c-type biogenesis protein CcmE
LIYQERTTHAILIKAMAVALGIVAVATLFFGSGLVTFAAIAFAGLTLWAIAKLVELFTVGSTSIEYHQVEIVDRLTQRIVGMVRSGMVYRLRVPDPSDFGLIASLVTG